MTTKPEWFIEFENKQNEFNKRVAKFMSDQDKCWKEQQEFNWKILSLVQSIINCVENVEHKLDKLESRIDNLVVKNNLKE